MLYCELIAKENTKSGTYHVDVICMVRTTFWVRLFQIDEIVL